MSVSKQIGRSVLLLVPFRGILHCLFIEFSSSEIPPAAFRRESHDIPWN